MAELIVKGLAKSFGNRAVLQDVNLSVPSGSLVAILGASGSGKTTLLRLLCGFEPVNAGTIRIEGRLVASAQVHVPPEGRTIGYVAQEGALFPHLSVADNIVFGLPRAERRARHRVSELLDMVGLSPAFADRPPQDLSGGEQQRVALARALAPGPKLVLLDEPFSALDTALRAETREAVATALAAAGATALLVTHDQPEALSMGDPVAVLRDGHLIQVASPRMLYRYPADADLARFVGDAVLLAGTAKDGRVECDLGRLVLAGDIANGPVEVLLRPEQIRLVSALDTAGHTARVEAVTFYGQDASVQLVCERYGRVTAVTARVPGHMAPRRGEIVGLVVEGRAVAYPLTGRPA